MDRAQGEINDWGEHANNSGGRVNRNHLEHGVLDGGEGARAWADSLGLGRASVALAEDGAGGDDHHVASAAKYQSRTEQQGNRQVTVLFQAATGELRDINGTTVDTRPPKVVPFPFYEWGHRISWYLPLMTSDLRPAFHPCINIGNTAGSPRTKVLRCPNWPSVSSPTSLT